MEKKVEAKCVCCGSEMQAQIIARFSPAFGVAVLALGVIFFAFFSIIMGLPLVVIGSYLTWAAKSIWECPECGTAINRCC